MTTDIYFSKIKPDAKIPNKKVEDMGLDIYACFTESYIQIDPHETKLIPTGIASSCPTDYGFVLRERGSTGSKGIAIRAGVIDSGYRDEWFVGLTNTTNKTLFISKLSKEELMSYMGVYKGILYHPNNIIVYPYEKAIAQALILPVPIINITEVTYDQLKEFKSERGCGKLGSSNK